jgi:cation diffusion facilitator CzcD-associated flavoprotein CzcO
MVPKDDRAFSPAELARFGRPWGARKERWRLWKEQHANTALRADDPLVVDRQRYAEEFLQKQIPDVGLRTALTPDYPFRCKRVLLGSDYYAALQRDTVRLSTARIRQLTRSSIITDAGETELDVIVLATGFQTSQYLSGIEVIGTAGQSLHARWAEDPRAYLGVAVSGFPNFFMLYGPNTNQGGNSIVYILEAGARLMAAAVRSIAKGGGSIDVSPAAELRFNAEIDAELEQTVWTRCGSYFRAPNGRIVTQWPYTELEYARRTYRLHKADWVHRTGARHPAVEIR